MSLSRSVFDAVLQNVERTAGIAYALETDASNATVAAAITAASPLRDVTITGPDATSWIRKLECKMPLGRSVEITGATPRDLALNLAEAVSSRQIATTDFNGSGSLPRILETAVEAADPSYHPALKLGIPALKGIDLAENAVTAPAAPKLA